MDGLENNKVEIKKDYRSLYFEFLRDLKQYLPEFMKEECLELTIAEIPVKKTVKLFDGYTQGTVIIKNQGNNACYLSTTGQGGFRLDPGQREKFFINHQVLATTISGSTVLGFIKT